MSLIDATEMPLVIINRNVTQARDRAIFFEQETAAFQAVEYLITQGHRDIACITLPVHTPTGTSRVAGYRKALEKYGIPWQPAKVKYGDYTLTRGYDACRELLEEGVTFSALFACNDDTALGAAKRCARPDYASRRMCRCLVLTMRRAQPGLNRGFQQSIYPSRI